jgi:ATPase subunit of ABC transporter with duplicated ATPase domains
LQGIRLERVGPDTRTFLVAFENAGRRYELRLEELSDGQRALIALCALTRITEGQGYALFLDEPDNYLALSEIQPWLMALEDACGSVVPQAVLCSHHPEIVDYLGAEVGVWLDRTDAGPTTIRPLPEPKEGSLRLSELMARGWVP